MTLTSMMVKMMIVMIKVLEKMVVNKMKTIWIVMTIHQDSLNH